MTLTAQANKRSSDEAIDRARIEHTHTSASSTPQPTVHKTRPRAAIATATPLSRSSSSRAPQRLVFIASERTSSHASKTLSARDGRGDPCPRCRINSRFPPRHTHLHLLHLHHYLLTCLLTHAWHLSVRALCALSTASASACSRFAQDQDQDAVAVVSSCLLCSASRSKVRQAAMRMLVRTHALAAKDQRRVVSCRGAAARLSSCDLLTCAAARSRQATRSIEQSVDSSDSNTPHHWIRIVDARQPPFLFATSGAEDRGSRANALARFR